MILSAETEARSKFPITCDHYAGVGKDSLKDNLAYRADVWKRCNRNESFRKQCWEASKHDILFWINTFAFIHEPRIEMLKRPGMHVMPWMTYPYQDGMFIEMLSYLGWKDIGIEKSRDLGATWAVCALYHWCWTFWPESVFGMMSRNEKLVERTGVKGTLFWKVDFLYDNMPPWMRPNRRRNLFVRENLDNNSSIAGVATGPDAFRGDRLLSILMDEYAAFELGQDTDALAATQHATSSRIFLSTPHGPIGEYYRIMNDPDSDMAKIELDWKEHPDRVQGLYRVKNGVIIDLNEDNPLTEEQKKDLPEIHNRLRRRGFEVEGMERSPYYDRECLRSGATPKSIAQELDRDYGGSASKFFIVKVVQRHQKYCRPPHRIGNLNFDPETCRPKGFVDNPDGDLRLWTRLNEVRERPPEHENYVVAADIGGGMGGVKTSNSVLSVFNQERVEKVAELASRTILPMTLGRLAVALCYFFNGRREAAYLIWEDNGTWGDQFRTSVIDSGFRFYYHRKVMDEAYRRPTRKPGWRSTRNTKPMLLGEYRRALGDDEVSNPSFEALNECLDYIMDPRGLIVHAGAYNADDPAGAGENHGDRVIADALGVWVCLKEVERSFTPDGRPRVNPWNLPIDQVPENSYLFRRKMWEEAEKRKNRREPW